VTADFSVVLDACVLANFGVCDLFLRLAEHPRLYTPRWSEDILAEVKRTHLRKLKWPKKLAESWQQKVRANFPEAPVMSYEPLVPKLQNQQKDRHVLAAAIKGHASLIVTFNLKDFPETALQPWGVKVAHHGKGFSHQQKIRPRSRENRAETRDQPETFRQQDS
jgi:predicted nucleic acid-binding protein